ncbi:hypothetical protein B0I35DRAFT_480228 [Stachybotrys elegans]|uniref:C2H2-type domain-containing protein n=1 Tax=Stachybotrys elegans TaxID=80388 RepID=A0A8K0SRS7_9HYPO|nr:hypothetical protein B0I35DRAFT_480228 [Stachybotrys elegans]
MSINCTICSRPFNGIAALRLHYGEAHVYTLDHEPSGPVSATQDGPGNHEGGVQEQHVGDPPVQQQSSEFKAYQKSPPQELLPLDEFFLSFSTFNYNTCLSPTKSFSQLQMHKGWKRGEPAFKQAWGQYQQALGKELKMWFGAEDSLAAWHTLCRAVGVEPLPLTCEDCEKVLRNTHVNIIDLIEWGRSDDQNKVRVRVFSSVDTLKQYTFAKDKVKSDV